jgi:hypothetical protein
MESEFLCAVDLAVEEALPAGWPRVPSERLPARGAVRARHAFRMRDRTGPESYLVIVAAPQLDSAPGDARSDLTALAEHVLACGATLLLLYQSRDDPDGWVHAQLGGPLPRMLTLECAASHASDADVVYQVEPAPGGAEPLVRTLRGLWSGELVYQGPREGSQTVGVEAMQDVCWQCQKTLDTVTGIVFPDREVDDWRSPDWSYFQRLVELATIPDSMIAPLARAVDERRALGETALTPIRWRYSGTAGRSYWAAECPACGAMRGAFPIMEARLGWLLDLESRRTGVLSYRPLQLDVPRQLLREMAWGWELSPHARASGWCHPDAPDPRCAPASGYPPSRSCTAGRAVTAAQAAAPITPKALRSWQRLGQALTAWLGLRRLL